MTVSYTMTPITNGTRLRTDHNTFSTVITSFNAGELLAGDELWEAPADGNEVLKGDKWLHVTHRNGAALPVAGWTAYIHKGQPICNNFKVMDTTPEPEPEPPTDPAPMFPESFTLIDPTGAKAEYAFVRVIVD